MKITLIRHTSVDVPKGVCYGSSDVPLQLTFVEEAAEVYRRLRGIRFDKVYTSPLTRCIRLASYCGFPDAERDNRLKELDFGKWEMQRFDEIRDPRLQEWYNDWLHVRATGGESFKDQYQRVAAFLDELKNHPYGHVGIFAHGGVLLQAQIYAGILRPEEAFEQLTPYGGSITVEIG